MVDPPRMELAAFIGPVSQRFLTSTDMAFR